MEKSLSGLRVRGALVQVNPILLIFRDRGNIYLLRKKVPGIHSQEALDQLRSVPHLKVRNQSLGADRVIAHLLNDVRDWLRKRFHSGFRQEIEELTYFIPWDIENNMPTFRVDISTISLDTLWIA